MQAHLQTTEIVQVEENRVEEDLTFKLLNEAVFWLFIIWPLASIATAIYFLVNGG